MKNIFKISNKDLFNLNENSEEWKKIKNNYEPIVKEFI
jgi:hypothetical protein